MHDIKAEKNGLRAEFLSKRRAIPVDIKKELDRRICENVINCRSYKYYDTILLFAALPDEPDLSALAEKALSDGKRVAYPRCIPGTRDMRFHFVTDLSQLKQGSYGIYEPDADLPVFDTSAQSCSLCIIPAVISDKAGYRIGYGGGYYDRFLNKFGGAAATAVYSGFVKDAVPHGKYDKKADMIITEGGIYQFV